MALLTVAQILDVARKTIAIFESHGLKCCLMGSAASYLHGVKRTPNDVDLVVLSTTFTQEALKELLVREDSQYTLVRSRNPRATYRVLWYRFPGTYERCKVDILIPGVLNLLLKLQGWSDHRASTRSDMQFKQYLDVRDIEALLAIVCRRGLRIDDEDAQWIPETMIADALSTLRRYVVYASPYGATDWRKLGFELPEESVVEY
ncbi:uncharacterized protein TRAVEDRAFT_75471 [Trametes versicolor FP-101664 SS1]|uniref:Uncharacterized protein n=1 Tax=Trametes versicolor (strain FP-101664) TaxID=717944 RepID=R7S7R2_TRAVS|nr:uncharacterized protein TRAVEDRAFT_75471 [Trametes versicolor FP-101664 SS1]EIW52046.1 hypothetical protein TRAVEDRAFT_75471 [Trametes versicolor FP-101664 SS1]